MLERFIKIFSGLERAYGVSKVDAQIIDGKKVKSQSFVKREKVTPQLWQDHLDGEEPSLGIIPIRDDNKCTWGCIDIDSYAGFDHQKLINKIKLLHLPLIVFRSKSGGAHVFLFATEATDAKIMRDKLFEVRAVLGFANSEVFPKQIELRSHEDTGNFLNLPYFNQKQTLRYAFLENGQAASLDGFFGLYERNKVDNVEKIKVKRPESEFSDGPPCLESLTQSKLADGTDRTLYQYGVYAKKKYPNEWVDKVQDFNFKYFLKPKSVSEVNAKMKSWDKKTFHYKCDEEPMCNHCDKSLCKLREFGIGDDSTFPLLSDLQKINIETPYYYLNVDGLRLKLRDVKHIRQQSLFQESCMEQLNFFPPILNSEKWRKKINELLKIVETVEPPAGLRTEDQLQNHLEEFCTNRRQSPRKEDIERGNVWTNKGEHHFKFLHFFHDYLMKMKWTMGSQETAVLLKEQLDCRDKVIEISSKSVRVMVVKAFDRPKENYKSPKYREEEIF